MSHHNNTTAGAFFLSSSPRDLLSLPLRAWSNLWDNGAEAGTGAAAAMVEGITAETAGGHGGYHLADVLQVLRSFVGPFSYLASRWSLTCLTIALVINRVTIYAATRRPLNFNWQRRLALRIVPILLLLSQVVVLLRAIRCQTSPHYPLIRHGNPDKRLLIDYSASGGFLHALSSKLLSWESEQQSCRAVHMVKPNSESDAVHGTYSLLWPVFLRLCLSHLVENLSCALQRRRAATETGMSIFEHSMAFAEAESMVSQSIGLGMFGFSKQHQASRDTNGTTPSPASDALSLLTRAEILDRMNVPPELLLIALISCCNSLASNLLDVFGKQSRFRLLSTTIWGLCYMTAIIWGSSDLNFASKTGVLKFPGVCFVGFLPHIIILLGIFTCGIIYSVALTITAFSLPVDHPTSIRERFRLAHDNMQGSSQIRSIRVNRHDDFYTMLLMAGYISLAAARDAVFLNEGRGVVARRMTWLEEEKLAELAASRGQSSQRAWTEFDPNGAFDEDSVSFDLPDMTSEWQTGYGQEHRIEKPAAGSRSARARNDATGVGVRRGASRCYHGLSFFHSIFKLLLGWSLFGLGKALDKLGFESRPRWLKTSNARQSSRRVDKGPAKPLDFWILSDNGELELPTDHEFDVEEEMRRREHSTTDKWDTSHESRLDEKLYSWFKTGGSWGNQDQSPDYVPSTDDTDDTTSVISMSTTATDSEWEEYESESGRRTPTRSDPFPNDESSEDTLFDATTLARLLDPRDSTSKQEARILAAHLLSGQDGRIMTRAQYRRQKEMEQAQVLLTSRLYRDFANTSSSSEEKRKPTPEEEVEILERLIMSRRSASPNQEQQTWSSGAAGLGPDGPPCVICQTSPRSIITWPCRCLCVCEECRVSLAMNNFGSCVTCRQEVVAFLRLWVP